MFILSDSANKKIVEKVLYFYNKSDFLSLINYSKSHEIKKLIKSCDSFPFYTIGQKYLISNLHIFMLIGIGNYNLGRYKEANKYFQVCKKILNKLNEFVEIYSDFQEYNIDFINIIYREYERLIANNSFLKPIIYAYIAHSNFKMHNPILSSFYYCKAFKNSNELKLNNLEHKSIFVDILLGRCDSHYELTKIFITFIKISFFLITTYFIFAPFTQKIINLYLNLNKISYSIFINIFMFILILCLPKVTYKIFYFFLRKLRRFISVNFLQLFPKPFSNWLINLLNYINFKKFFSHKTYKQTIETIESIGEKDFNTFFAIAKVYYCLGDYKNSTFYIQRALSQHEKKNKSELAMAYHYLGRIAYKTSNNLTAIDFYNKAIENLMSVNKSDNNFRIEYLPSISNMIQYTQENRNKIEHTTFSRTYLPLIVTLIITMLVCIAQIYYNFPQHQNNAAYLFKKVYNFYEKIVVLSKR